MYHCSRHGAALTREHGGVQATATIQELAKLLHERRVELWGGSACVRMKCWWAVRQQYSTVP